MLGWKMYDFTVSLSYMCIFICHTCWHSFCVDSSSVVQNLITVLSHPDVTMLQRASCDVRNSCPSPSSSACIRVQRGQVTVKGRPWHSALLCLLWSSSTSSKLLDVFGLIIPQQCESFSRGCSASLKKGLLPLFGQGGVDLVLMSSSREGETLFLPQCSTATLFYQALPC